MLLLLTFASLGFEWQGRVDQLSQELRVAEAGRRRDIVRLLSSYGSPRAREAILAALTDPDPEVRAEAAEACGRLRLVEAIPELSEWLLDPLGETRAAAARALGAMNDAGSLPALIRTLGDTSAEVRIAAINALSSLGGDEVVTPLLGRLDDDDVTVRIAAASALGSLGDERAVVPLIGRARDDSAEVRVAVFTALGALGDVRALSALALGTRDTVEDARLTATLALGQLRSPRAIDPLRALLEQPDMRLRSAALDALAPIPDPRASGVILDALGGLPGAQAIAMEALVQRARSGLDETLVPALAERLGTATHQHATAIGRILSEIARTQPDERAVPALLEALRTGRGASAPLLLALGRLGGDVALVPILEHIGSSDAGTRRLSALTLGAMGAASRAMVPQLIAAIKGAKDPTIITVLFEDTAAMIGLLFALTGVGLTLATGNPYWDVYATFAIGGLLVLIAFFVSRETKSLLIGESADKEALAVIAGLVNETPGVVSLMNMRSMQLGDDEFLVTLKIQWEGDLRIDEVSKRTNELEDRIRATSPWARYVVVEPDIYDPVKAATHRV